MRESANFGDRRLPERIWAKVQPCPMSGCWLWSASLQGNGYGSLKIEKTTLAHRYFYTVLVGAIPEGLHIDHLCRVRCCVNPGHMEAVTCAENTRRSTAPAAAIARHAAVTHCPQGHPYDEQNTVRWQNSVRKHRLCRICKRIHGREYMRRRRALRAQQRREAA